jgi:hypothetical protein
MLEEAEEGLIRLIQEEQEDKEEVELEDLDQVEKLQMDKQILVVEEVEVDLEMLNLVLVDKVVLV